MQDAFEYPKMTNIEIGFIFICYIVGIGSILFGSLSGNNYGFYFIIIGVLGLVLVILHTARRTVQYNEKLMHFEESKQKR